MPRFFLAILLPDDAKDRLVAIQPSATPGMRIIGRQELHLTLQFLGELNPQHIQVVQKALAAMQMSAFAITIKGVGQFPPEGEPKVLWSGVEKSPTLLALHQAIGVSLIGAIGFRPEERPYSPHITLAHFNTPALPGIVERSLQENRDFQIGPVLVKQIALYSSVRGEGVPQYQEETVFDLHEPV